MVDKLPVMPIVKNARYDLQPVHYKDLGKAYYDVLLNEKATYGKKLYSFRWRGYFTSGHVNGNRGKPRKENKIY